MRRKNYLPQFVGHTFANAAQDAAGFLQCKGTLLPHVQLSGYQVPSSVFLLSCFLVSWPLFCTVA